MKIRHDALCTVLAGIIAPTNTDAGDATSCVPPGNNKKACLGGRLWWTGKRFVRTANIAQYCTSMCRSSPISISKTYASVSEKRLLRT